MTNLIFESIDFDNPSYIDLLIIFDVKSNTLHENKESESIFYGIVHGLWLYILNSLKNSNIALNTKINNLEINIATFGNLKLKLVPIDSFKQVAKYNYQDNSIYMKLSKADITFEEVLRDFRSNKEYYDAFVHEFRHFYKILLSQNFDKYSFIKNDKDLYSYYNSPSEFDAHATAFIDTLLQDSDIWNYENFINNKDKLESAKKMRDYLLFTIIPDIKNNKIELYKDFINHLNTKNLRKLYKRIYSYLSEAVNTNFKYCVNTYKFMILCEDSKKKI